MSLDQAREYLARVIPWPQPGETGFVNIHWTFPNPKTDAKPLWAGRAVTSMSEATKALEFALKPGSNTLDIYACMSQQTQALARTTKTGWKYNAPSRLAANAVSLRSFFLDIDLKGAPRGYDTIEELFEELGKFIKAVGLPKPTMVVHSGGGVHVYWIVDRALTPDEWIPYAFALAEATKQLGLRCDTQCTIDSARVLRVPDTFNHKQSPLRPVRFIGTPVDFDYSVQRITTVLDKFVGAAKIPTLNTAIDGLLFPRRSWDRAHVEPSELSANLDAIFYQPDLSLVAPACGFILDTLATGGSTLDYSLWNLTTLISTFTKGGRADAHRMGNKHADYTKESTDEFFDRKNNERLTRGLGWPACNTISATGAKACASCAFFAQGKSPLNFEQRNVGGAAGQINAGANPSSGNNQNTVATHQGTTATAFGAGNSTIQSGFNGHTTHLAPPSNIDMPPGYQRTPANIICKIVADPANPSANVLIPIVDYPILSAWIEDGQQKTLHFECGLQPNITTQVDLPLLEVNTSDMRKTLQGQGFMLTENDKMVGSFMTSWIKKLQNTKDYVKSAPFGWLNSKGNIDGFIYGDKLWTPTGNEPAAADAELSSRYRPKGSDTYWLEATKLVTLQGRPDLEAMVASAFAAPLVLFTGHSGVLMSGFSRETGIGKTTAVKIAQAVWGSPIKGVQGLTDTENAVMGIIGKIKSLPLYWDELKTDQDTKKFVKMTFQITSGKEKSRMNAKAQLREPGEWQTLVISASNESLVDHVTSQTLTTEAGLMRIFEFQITKSDNGKVSTSTAQIKTADLNNNYGHVGLKYAKFLGENHAMVASDMKDISALIEKETNAGQEERFWVAVIACVLLGAKYATQIGYPVFNEPELKKFMYESLEGMRRHRATQTVDLDQPINVSSIMQRFFNDMQRDNRWITTNRILVSKGKPPKPPSPLAIKVLQPIDTTRLNGVAVQLGVDDGLLRISSSAFGEWCKKAEINRQNLLDAVKKAVSVKTVQGVVGGGTGCGGVPEHTFELDLNSSTAFDTLLER